MDMDVKELATHDDTRLVGETLRRRRQIRGMSLRQVAEKAGISVGMLSQVERGLAAPSIKTLRAVCAAMDMPVNWLFHRDGEGRSPASAFIVPAGARRSLTYQGGALTKELLTPDTQPTIQMLRFVLQPGVSSGEPAGAVVWWSQGLAEVRSSGGVRGWVMRRTCGAPERGVPERGAPEQHAVAPRALECAHR